MKEGRKKILIVEDNPSNMKLFRFILEAVDCELLEAIDGAEALKVAEENNPHLILMDIQIPKMDGLEVTRKLREMAAFKETPIVALTAFAMDKDEEAGFEAGCTEYIKKPFNAKNLLDVLRKYLQED